MPSTLTEVRLHTQVLALGAVTVGLLAGILYVLHGRAMSNLWTSPGISIQMHCGFQLCFVRGAGSVNCEDFWSHCDCAGEFRPTGLSNVCWM